jgi:hypothetical protein
MRLAALVLALAVLCGIRAASRDDNWVEAGTPRAQEDAIQQTETAVTQIINQNTVRPNTQPLAYSTRTGQPDSNPALADEEYQSLKQRVIRANHTSFSLLFDAIRSFILPAFLPPFSRCFFCLPLSGVICRPPSLTHPLIHLKILSLLSPSPAPVLSPPV